MEAKAGSIVPFKVECQEDMVREMMAGLKPAKTGRTDGISAQPLLDTRGDAREFTILDAEGIEFCTRRFGANDTLRELRLFVIKFSAPLPWITPANENFFKYFRFPQE
ncbi:hypothetical protein CYMTET_24394 [Cymbomonas tetramitiformis]|uniref:Uncharacterized protein n=1 Tax=Cymbomonas tetramitiformis TaxID=36881 RepID=A0AAE0FW77_9CHLO|nr:hypothetical protein CYMTET_24394 [Cymbomonas tetramitiformis]